MNESRYWLVRIREVHHEAQDLWSVDVALGGTNLAASHKVPGQYVEVRVPGEPAANYFVLASDPGTEDRFELLLKAGSPLPDRILGMGAGANLEVSPAMGHGFPLERHRGKNLLMLAMGSGIAAIRPLVHEVLAHRSDYGHVSVVYGVRTSGHMAYRDLLRSWERRGVRIVISVSRPGDDRGWEGMTGYVQHNLTEEFLGPGPVAVFICGSPGMEQGVRERLEGLGFPDIELHKNF